MKPTTMIGDFGTGGAPSVQEDTVYVDPDTVKRVQAALGIKVDGIYGPETRGAVKKWNETHGNASNGSSITDKTLSTLPTPKMVGRSASTAMIKVPTTEGVPFWQKNVPGIDRPVWMVALGGAGVLAIGGGLLAIFTGGKRRRRR